MLKWLWLSSEPLCMWPAVSLGANEATGAVVWCRCGLRSYRRLWLDGFARAAACRRSPPVRHTGGRCSSRVWKRQCCKRRSMWSHRSIDCAHGAWRGCYSRGCRTAGESRWSRRATWAATRPTGCCLRRRQRRRRRLSDSAHQQDNLGLVGVEVEAVLQEPPADSSRAVGEPVVSSVHVDE